MAKRCPCDTSSKKAAKPASLDTAFGAEGTSAYSGPGAPSAEIEFPESLSAPDVSVHIVTEFPEGDVCVGEFIGADGARYRQMRRKRGGGYLDWSEPAD